jgi:hypothetical protein
MRLTVSVDSKNVQKRLSNLERAIDKTGKATVPQTARWIRDKIITRMPKDTGNTAKSIGIKKETHTKGKDEVIVGLRFIPYGSGGMESWKKGSKNLVDFMFNSPMAVTGFYPYGNRNAGLVTFSKDVRSMRNVPFEAKEKFGHLIRRNFKDI